MIVLRLLLVLLIAIALPGCLLVETFEYHVVIDKEGHHATAETVYRNIRSDHIDEQFDIDFNEMIESWKGDQYLQERMKEGIKVTDRKLAIEKGVLVGRQTSTFGDDAAGYKDFFSKTNVRLSFYARDVDSIMKCNGKLTTKGDSLIVTWPEGAKDFRIAVKFKMKTQSGDFVPKFKAYLAKH